MKPSNQMARNMLDAVSIATACGDKDFDGFVVDGIYFGSRHNITIPFRLEPSGYVGVPEARNLKGVICIGFSRPTLNIKVKWLETKKFSNTIARLDRLRTKTKILNQIKKLKEVE